MFPGSVDPKTGNVPLRLDNDFVVHFEGRNADGTVLVRIARSTTSPVLGFHDAKELHRYIATLPSCVRQVGVEEVAEWLDTRAAEPVTS